MNKARIFALIALALYAFLGALQSGVMLHAFVPEPYFLKNQSQLKESYDDHSYLTKAAMPYIVGTSIIFLGLCMAACITNSSILSILLIVTPFLLFGITLLRLFVGGGISGGL